MTAPVSGSVRFDLRKELAAIGAVEQFAQRIGRIFQAIDDVLAVLQLTVLPSIHEIGIRLIEPIEVVEENISLHRRPVDVELEPVGQRLRRCVVAGKRTAEHDPGAGVKMQEKFIQHRAADIVEDDIDAVRTEFVQCCGDIRRLVVDALGGSERLDPCAFLVVARKTDDAAAGRLQQLDGNTADAAGSGRDDRRFADLRFADIVNAEPGCLPVDAENIKRELEWRTARNLRILLPSLTAYSCHPNMPETGVPAG